MDLEGGYRVEAQDSKLFGNYFLKYNYDLGYDACYVFRFMVINMILYMEISIWQISYMTL